MVADTVLLCALACAATGAVMMLFRLRYAQLWLGFPCGVLALAAASTAAAAMGRPNGDLGSVMGPGSLREACHQVDIVGSRRAGGGTKVIVVVVHHLPSTPRRSRG